MPREPADIAVFTLRLREKLRDRLEREAKKHQTSMNDEIIRRLEDSLRGEDLAEVVTTSIESTMDVRFAQYKEVLLRVEQLMMTSRQSRQWQSGERINPVKLAQFKKARLAAMERFNRRQVVKSKEKVKT
jgi:Arc-like DNA binding domain